MATRLDSVHRFNVDEYHRMGELGILPEHGVELIEGRIVFAGDRPWRFDVDDYYRLAEAGILTEDDRVELIDGEIIDMAPAGSRHAACVSRLNRLLVGRVRDAIVRVQDPLRVWGPTEPEPDLAVVRFREDFYIEHHPTPGDVLLVVEVADSSVGRDRTEKAEMYATVGIREYWLVDLTQSAVLVHTSPSGAGYLSVDAKQREDTWTSHSLPGLTVSGTDIFG